jgi:hypothetical protein
MASDYAYLDEMTGHPSFRLGHLVTISNTTLATPTPPLRQVGTDMAG